MKYKYFKSRGRLDFHTHPFNVGRFLSWWESHYDYHFLLRLYERSENEFGDFYQYHLTYFLKENAGATEEEFFEHVFNIVGDRIEQLVKEDKSGSGHAQRNSDKLQLRAFQKYLQTIDQWYTGKSKDEIIAAKEEEIKKLKEQVTELKQDLKAARKLETDDYINIADGYLLSFLDLCLQAQEAKLDNGKELVLSQTQIVWGKMVCKYFREGDKPINLDTIRRYFPGDKREPGTKYADIPAKSKLFKIEPAKKRTL